MEHRILDWCMDWGAKAFWCACAAYFASITLLYVYSMIYPDRAAIESIPDHLREGTILPKTKDLIEK